jgi:ERCC4-type nuclease
MIVRIDTREQQPLDIAQFGAEVTRQKIPSFDYALEGDQERFAIERKSLADFIQSVVMKDSYRREVAKIRRAKDAGMTRIFYVIESNFTAIHTYNFDRFLSGFVHPGLVYKRWRELTYKQGVQFVWADDAHGAAWAVFLLLKTRAEELRAIEEDK